MGQLYHNYNGVLLHGKHYFTGEETELPREARIFAVTVPNFIKCPQDGLVTVSAKCTICANMCDFFQDLARRDNS